MGEANLQEQLNRVADTRAALDQTIDELFAALPAKAELVGKAKQAAVASGAAFALLGAGGALLRRKAEESKKEKDAQRHADALARAFANVEAAKAAKSAIVAVDDQDGSGPPLLLILAALAGIAVAVWQRLNA